VFDCGPYEVEADPLPLIEKCDLFTEIEKDYDMMQRLTGILGAGCTIRGGAIAMSHMDPTLPPINHWGEYIPLTNQYRCKEAWKDFGEGHEFPIFVSNDDTSRGGKNYTVVTVRWKDDEGEWQQKTVDLYGQIDHSNGQALFDKVSGTLDRIGIEPWRVSGCSFDNCNVNTSFWRFTSLLSHESSTSSLCYLDVLCLDCSMKSTTME